MKKKSKKNLQEIQTTTLNKKQMSKIKGGDDYIGTQDLVDT